MLKIQELDKKLFEYFSRLKYYIENNNKNGYFDINKYYEDFFNDLLNLVFDLKLINLNGIKTNYPAIDLGDKESRICYQVTTIKKIEKIESTLKKFHETELYKVYDSVNILILGDKTKHTKKLKFKEVNFNYDDNIIDLNDLLKSIINIKNINKKEQIVKFIEKSLIENVEKKNMTQKNHY
ncbi:SMEK domain-containing protein [Clostridium gasigenes]|uniref:SMEK domain-containing protein n=1 Tax=Clostridium gasigenes TaxID=94869 RepID=UPI001C0E2263|nr:SMEK domain-containing protein [Clostridium gasigenes]MBU3089823.1 SMEK domain-containing protein [Clostridium gasigenes]